MKMDIYRCPRFTNRELLRIFPEAKQIIPEKLQEALARKEQFIDFIVRPYLKEIRRFQDDFTRWFYKEVLKVFTRERLSRLNLSILRLKRFNNLIVSNGRAESVEERYEANLEQARQSPLLEIVNSLTKLRKGGKNYVGKCPLHQERSPSFYVYPETNSFYCFGCHKGGDVIKFVELYYGYDFKGAIEYLNGGR